MPIAHEVKPSSVTTDNLLLLSAPVGPIAAPRAPIRSSRPGCFLNNYIGHYEAREQLTSSFQAPPFQLPIPEKPFNNGCFEYETLS
jgi:hypothetical protein